MFSATPDPMRLIPCLLLSAALLRAAEPSELDRPVENLRLENAPLPAALRTLARATGVTIHIEPDVTGDVTVEISRGTLRSALVALTRPNGFHFEETAGGIAVRFRKTVLYPVDYPQLTRSGSGSASITLGGANNGNYGTGYPGGTLPNSSQALGPNSAGSDATQVSISQENQNTFWSGLEAELRAMLKDGDSLVLNKFSGVVQVTAPVARHDNLRAFLELVNTRITRQVEIEARIVEVTLRDERKLGIDWDLAAGAVGKVSVEAGAPLDVVGVGGTLLAPNTFAANLGFGRATAVIHALQQQGEVTTVAQPRLRALNNQTAFIKIGEDRPFFRLQQSTTFQQGGTTVPVNQTQENYSVSTITIGTILAVTPQIDGNGVITLDVLPAITRLQAIVTSPDGKQTAPLTEVKQASTIVRLKDGETAVIGGLISEDTGSSTRAVPILGSIPVAGRAFKTKATLHNRTELVIFLTPKLVR
jgi:MSHA biogenesis protein MshL